MSRIGLPVVLALVLSGCRPPLPPPLPLPSLPVTDADFSGALAQAPTSGPLGLTPKFQGKVADWSISGSRPVSLDWPQKTIVGTIDDAGNYSVTLSTQPPEAQQMTLTQLVRQFNILEKYDCSVDTLVISAPDARAAEQPVFYVARNAVNADTTLQPQYQPPPPYAVFHPFTQYFNAVETLLYSSTSVTVKGELACNSPEPMSRRSHLFVNIALAEGWNSATLIYGEEQTGIGGGEVQKLLLKGGLGKSGLGPVSVKP